MSVIQERYTNQSVPQLQEEFAAKSNFAVPKIVKTVVNIGIGKISQAPGDTARKHLEAMEREIGLITGQKPAKRPARTSIAGFKLRKGSPAGLAVTLRGRRMWDFLDRLVLFAVPRMRDFRGIELRAVDESGNLNIGIREQLIFPELPQDELHTPFSFQVSVVTNAGSHERGLALFRALGFPLKKSA